MIGKYFFKTCTRILAIVFYAMASQAFAVCAQPVNELGWSDKPLKINKVKFYIAELKDGRADKKAIAYLIPAPISTKTTITNAQPYNLQGGTLNRVTAYLKTNFPEVANFYPIAVKVRKLIVMEKALHDGRIDGNLDIALTFEINTGEDLYLKLVDYQSGTHYVRYPTQQGTAGLSLHQSVENAMAYFNTWVNQQVNTNPLLAKKVRLQFSDYNETPEADTIYYTIKRPLTWDDFKDKPRGAHFDAMILPGLGFTEKTSIENGVINIAIAIKAYMPKSAAWVKPGQMDAYNLNHEQRHFDISKIVGERLKKKLLSEQLPVYNYDGYINVAYFDALREHSRMQKQYDDETNHGSNASAQARWNSFIDKELNALTN